MKNEERFLVSFVKQFCQKNDITLNVYSQGWLFNLEKGGRKHSIFGYDLGLNSSVSQQIANDKFATFEVLRGAGVPCVEHAIFHQPSMNAYVNICGNWTPMLAIFERALNDVVCKPVSGTGGQDVMRAQTVLELEDATQKLFSKYRSICLSPFIQISGEYRAIVLRGECVTIFRKKRPRIVGDGTSTVLELATAYARKSGARLELEGISRERDLIVPLGQERIIEWRHNLALGSAPIVVDRSDNLFPPLSSLAIRAAKSLGLTFASVDIADSGGMQVLEVNSGVMMEQFARHSKQTRAIAESIYSAALSSVIQ